MGDVRGIATASPDNLPIILTVMGGLAEFERKLIRQRCDEGIKRAKARGTVFGRKPVLDAGERRKIASDMPQANRWQI